MASSMSSAMTACAAGQELCSRTLEERKSVPGINQPGRRDHRGRGHPQTIMEGRIRA
ncbi:MAG: hypothetical protein ACLSAH_08775 [Bilophila wadsworthia]